MLVYMNMLSSECSTRIHHKNFWKSATQRRPKTATPRRKTATSPRRRKTLVSGIGGIGGGITISNTPRNSWWARLSIKINLCFYVLRAPPQRYHCNHIYYCWQRKDIGVYHVIIGPLSTKLFSCNELHLRMYIPIVIHILDVLMTRTLEPCLTNMFWFWCFAALQTRA